jgi:hypothetical protein
MVKEFATIGELVKDPVFISEVDKKLNELRKKRYNRPASELGFHYKRDWYNRMGDAGQLSTKFFLANIEDIWNKRSKLSSEVRSIIQYVCESALIQTHEHYGQIKEEVEAPKPKATRKRKVVVMGDNK